MKVKTMINQKPLYQSLTAVVLMVLLAFNVIDEATSVQVTEQVNIVVNGVLTLIAIYGRWRASKEINSFL